MDRPPAAKEIAFNFGDITGTVKRTLLQPTEFSTLAAPQRRRSDRQSDALQLACPRVRPGRPGKALRVARASDESSPRTRGQFRKPPCRRDRMRDDGARALHAAGEVWTDESGGDFRSALRLIIFALTRSGPFDSGFELRRDHMRNGPICSVGCQVGIQGCGKRSPAIDSGFSESAVGVSRIDGEIASGLAHR